MFWVDDRQGLCLWSVVHAQRRAQATAPPVGPVARSPARLFSPDRTPTTDRRQKPLPVFSLMCLR